jgi:hypothetical protein
MWLQGIIIVVVIWFTMIVGTIGIASMVVGSPGNQIFMDLWWIPLNLWYWGIALAILIPGTGE